MDRIPNIGTLDAEISSWERLLAGHLSDETIAGYTYGVRQFEQFLEAHGLPTQIRDIERAHVEEFISGVLQRSKPWTAQARFRDLQQFFRYLVDTGEIDISPLAQIATTQAHRGTGPHFRRTASGRGSRLVGTLFRGPARYLSVFIDAGARLAEVLAYASKTSFCAEAEVSMTRSEHRDGGGAHVASR